MKPLFLSALLLAAASVHAQGIHISPAGSLPAQPGSAANFSGEVSVEMKTAGQSAVHGSVGMLHFAPGARTIWHTHPRGQLLVITEGRGWVQEEGQPRHEVGAGDVVWIDPDIRHWHGATDTSAVRYWGLSYRQDGISVEWQEPVSDAQYHAR